MGEESKEATGAGDDSGSHPTYRCSKSSEPGRNASSQALQNVNLSKSSGVSAASSTSSSTPLIYRQDRRPRVQPQGPQNFSLQDVNLGEQTFSLLGSDSQQYPFSKNPDLTINTFKQTIGDIDLETQAQ